MNNAAHALPTASATPDDRGATLGFRGLLLGHLILWTLIPALMYQTLPRDTLEGIVWGRQWLLGYDKHPFLAPWISAGLTDFFGVVGWPMFVASQLAVALCFCAVWTLARRLLDPWRAFIAVAVLEGINYYNICSFTFNPNMAMLGTWPMVVLTLHQAMTRPRLWRWLHAGVWAGLALLAKYESVVLFLALLIPLLTTAQGRRAMTTGGPYAAALAALAVASPNLFWLMQHDFISLRYADNALGLGEAPLELAAGRFHEPLKFLLQQLGAVIPALLLFAVFRRSARRRIDWNDFDSSFVFFIALGPLLVILLIALVSGAKLYTHWGYPFFSFLGVALAFFLPPVVESSRLKRFAAAIAGLTVLLGAGLYAVIYVRPAYTGKPPFSITFPSRTLAAQVTDEWHRRTGSPLRWVAGDRYLVAGVSAYSADKPKPFFDHDRLNNPWWSEAAMRQEGAALVVKLGSPEDQPAALQKLQALYPDVHDSHIIELPQLSPVRLPPELFLIAYLPAQPTTERR